MYFEGQKLGSKKAEFGRIKKQFSKVAKHYNITYTEDTEKGIVTDIEWKLQKTQLVNYCRKNAGTTMLLAEGR